MLVYLSYWQSSGLPARSQFLFRSIDSKRKCRFLRDTAARSRYRDRICAGRRELIVGGEKNPGRVKAGIRIVVCQELLFVKDLHFRDRPPIALSMSGIEETGDHNRHFRSENNAEVFVLDTCVIVNNIWKSLLFGANSIRQHIKAVYSWIESWRIARRRSFRNRGRTHRKGVNWAG